MRPPRRDVDDGPRPTRPLIATLAVDDPGAAPGEPLAGQVVLDTRDPREGLVVGVSVHRAVEGPGEREHRELCALVLHPALSWARHTELALADLSVPDGLFSHRGTIFRVEAYVRLRVRKPGRRGKQIASETAPLLPRPPVVTGALPRRSQAAGLRWALWRRLDTVTNYWFWAKGIIAIIAASLVLGMVPNKTVAGLVVGLGSVAVLCWLAWGWVLRPLRDALGDLGLWLRHRAHGPDSRVLCLGDTLELPDLSADGLAWRLVLLEQAAWRTGPKGHSGRVELCHREHRQVIAESPDGQDLRIPNAGPPSFQTPSRRLAWSLELYKPHDPDVACRMPLHVAFATRPQTQED